MKLATVIINENYLVPLRIRLICTEQMLWYFYFEVALYKNRILIWQTHPVYRDEVVGRNHKCFKRWAMVRKVDLSDTFGKYQPFAW